jgi:gas vesicle protein
MAASGFVAGFIVGAAIGASAALLLAPRSGTGARQWLLATAPQALEPGTVERVRSVFAHRLAAAQQAFQQGRVETRARMARELQEARHRPPLPTGPPPIIP